MKKTKRISLIVKGAGIVTELLGIREKKVSRAVDSAADYAQEQILEEESKKLKAVKALGEGADDTAACKAAINAYCDACEAVDAWKKKAEYIDMLKADLQAEVTEE